VGIRNPQQAKGVAGAVDLDLTDADIAQIEEQLVSEPV